MLRPVHRSRRHKNIEKQREDWEQSKILGLAAAYSVVEAARTADPFGLD